jgi:UDP-3-O-[3-hydroxymyristoyl] glucosamine N-acyltransferase
LTTIKDILDYIEKEGIDFSFQGDPSLPINGFSSFESYSAGTLSWLKSQSNVSNDPKKWNGLIIVQQGIEANFDNQIKSGKSKEIFFSIINHFFEAAQPSNSIGENTYISNQVKIGADVFIGHNCVLDGDIIIGDGTRIHNNVTLINQVTIGRNCVIHSGVVIGEDGFSYFERDSGAKIMINHHGKVVIGDNVLIGPNSVIDRGTIKDTVISSGCKIDGQCFIAHNCHLNQNVTLIAGSKLYGSSTIGQNTYIASAIIRNQIHVGNNVVVGMGSVVTVNIPDDVTVIGIPAKIMMKERV